MTIPHVAAGGQCDPDAQNTMIDKVNTDQGRIDTLETDVSALETEVDGKPDLCSEAGQDVADTGAAGSAITAARCDHVHKGVAKLVAGTNITLDPASGLGEVTVTATGGGMTVTRVTYTGDGQADHWVELGVAPKMVYFFITTTGYVTRLWLFNGSTGIWTDGTGLSEHAGLASGTQINVGSNGLANTSWGDAQLNVLARSFIVYVFS